MWIADKFCIFARLKQSLSRYEKSNFVVNCWQILYLCTSETIKRPQEKLELKLWIADKFCIFARLKQLTNKKSSYLNSCELLTNFVSLHVWNNTTIHNKQIRAVVNCWQILYLCTSETIDEQEKQLLEQLWIADKFCIFARLKQYNDTQQTDKSRCELLTNFVSLHVWNNKKFIIIMWRLVVNCWQILYLCTSETIPHASSANTWPLWIADKFCIFARLKQLSMHSISAFWGCELLTNFVSLHVWNNYIDTPICLDPVVNCWQILYLCTSETIIKTYKRKRTELWIADKFCIFARLKQFIECVVKNPPSCELLTNFVSLHVWNNAPKTAHRGKPVVNCWQILYLCTSETIYNDTARRLLVLWIADKFCIFARLKQYTRCSSIGVTCCELLTNFVSLHVWNNYGKSTNQRRNVVNCWQILYLCTSETMHTSMSFSLTVLWIADKFCIFARLKQSWQFWHITTYCCELLTNFVSLHVWNNVLWIFDNSWMLWIADKFCIFARLKQSSVAYIYFTFGCELLSNFVSLHVWNNSKTEKTNFIRVVNCSQILYLCTSETIG